MKLALPVAMAALLAAAINAPALARTTYLETEPHTFAVSRNHRVKIDFPVGELRVVPGDASQVRFEIRIRCKNESQGRCEELADRLRFESDDSNGTLSLKLDRYPKWCKGFQVTGVLTVPRALPVDVEMGVGQLTIDGIEGDIEVDLGVGDADVRMPRALADHVSVDTGIGDASIQGARGETERRSFIGSHATWAASSNRTAGSGRSSVRLHVGVGDATVRLD
jgi:hypothetical protein